MKQPADKVLSAPVKVAAIGGSAGALSAFQELLGALPADCGAAFVVLQHLSAERESLLDKILGASTKMPVVLAREGVPLTPNHVYVMPAGHFMTIAQGVLHLAPIAATTQPHRPIDIFFHSLAQAQPEHAVGVVLSGTIDDGTLGLIDLKTAGAATLVQDPASAEFDGMPKSALKTGRVDLVAPPAGLARALCQWAGTGRLSLDVDVGSEGNIDVLDGILALVRNQGQRDLRGYKHATLQRRIERRMALLHLKDMANYQQYLRDNPAELDRLARDLLIGVTSFFRDPDAFGVLAKSVVPAICSGRQDAVPVRVWIAGCSTGEEAYSVAIQFFEWFEQAGLPPRLQMFASDIDEAALEVARNGRYSSESLRHLSPERLKRYFTRTADGYKIAKQVREAIVFAAHNLISDPPFSKLDLLVCRNVLIYLAPETQKRLVTLFRFVLNKGGYLFLGSSETVGPTSKKFEVVSKQWRIFRNLSTPRVHRPELPLVQSTGISRRMLTHDLESEPDAEVGHERTYRQIVERYGPTLLVIDRKHDILYVSGIAAPYLEFPSGEPSHDLFQVVRPALRVALRSVISRAQRPGGRTATVVVQVGGEGEHDTGVRITATAVEGHDRRKLMLVSFESAPSSTAALPLSRPGGDDWILQQLEQELTATREDLHRTIEKMRVGNEELKASNEEAMAMNEELQSANEELESSKEELQSLNEELATANAALDVKVAELEATNTDLNNLLVSTEMATLFLDPDFRIRRFTPACTRLMHLIPSDIGRPLLDIAHRFEDEHLFDDGRSVLAGEPSISREVSDKDGGWYLRRVLPYRTMDEKVAGVVVTFTDVSTMKRAQEEITRKADELQKQAQLLQHAHVLARDMEDRIMFWNRGAEQFYGWSQKEALGKVAHQLLCTQFPEPLAEIKAKLMREGSWNGELVHLNRDGQKRIVASHWDIYRNNLGEPTAIVEVNNDITETKQFENRLVESQRDLDYLAHHDSLTQLPNRVLFRDRLQHAMAMAQSSGKRLAILFLDIDRFKNINEGLGHDAGDRLVLELAKRLESSLGRHDTLARTGGDEFAVLIEGLDDVAHASKHAQDLMESVRAPIHIDGQELVVTVSVGISVYPDDSTRMEDLLKNADAAMYLAKERGRDGYQFFTNELQQRASRFLAIETRLRRAIEQGSLALHYQPQVELRTGRIHGAEALARWTCADLGRVPPDEFIQVAEESGLIVPLGQWAVRTACEQIAAWLAEGITPPVVAVNISASQYLEPDFIGMVEKTLAQTGVPPQMLELELTERILMKDLDMLVAGMIELKRLGVLLSMDDFGTGYSSLSFLHRLPLDHLKVAREFIPQHPGDGKNLSIARTIVTLAKSLELRCTVEGIETTAQLAPFKEWGCDMLQGYLISQPLAVGEFTQLLRSSPRYEL